MDLGWRRFGAACYLSFQRGAALFSLSQKERKGGCKRSRGSQAPEPLSRAHGARHPPRGHKPSLYGLFFRLRVSFVDKRTGNGYIKYIHK